MLYVRNSLPSNRRIDIEIPNLECLWVEVVIKKTKVLFGLFYRPPDSQASAWDHINHSIEKALNTGIQKVVVMGDFNENQLGQNQNKLKNILLQNGLHQAISDPTFFCETSSSLLDPLIVNNIDTLAYCEVSENILEANVRYHCPVSGVLNLQKTRNKTFKRKVWDYKHGNYELYREDITSTDWDSLINRNHLNTAVESVTKTIIEIADKHIPSKYIQVRTQDPPWMTSNIKRMIRKRKRLHKSAKKRDTPQSWSNFRRTRNICVSLVRNAKIQHFSRQTSLCFKLKRHIH